METTVARTYPPLEIRFWQKVRKSDGCWEWQARRFKDGYGALNVDGTTTLAHRVSYSLNVGPIPDGLWVLHTCDNPSCVRPDHLFLGNAADNVADMDAKGRRVPNAPRGEAHTQSKLTDDVVREIRLRIEALPRSCSGKCAKRGSVIALAAEYGISKSNIQRIAARELWRHVT